MPNKSARINKTPSSILLAILLAAGILTYILLSLLPDRAIQLYDTYYLIDPFLPTVVLHAPIRFLIFLMKIRRTGISEPAAIIGFTAAVAGLVWSLIIITDIVSKINARG